jgi:hypothetical protein
MTPGRGHPSDASISATLHGVGKTSSHDGSLADGMMAIYCLFIRQVYKARRLVMGA